MRELQFNIHFCGMSEETFADKIMIDKPFHSIKKSYSEDTLRQFAIVYVSELIDHLKNDIDIKEGMGTWEYEDFTLSSVYIRYHDYLLGLKEDKTISAVYHELEAQQLEFAYFAIVGGASIHCINKYVFTIHSNEKIHEHMPHVHVSKDGIDIRYSLETLQPIDPLKKPHKHDNKKIITPFLQDNHERLLEMWNFNINGYSTPEITHDGEQFYRRQLN
jgi:hypothetical protein